MPLKIRVQAYRLWIEGNNNYNFWDALEGSFIFGKKKCNFLKITKTPYERESQ